MKVHIEDNIYLESDSNQYVVKKYSGRVDKKGKPHYTVLGYYTSLKQVILGLLKLKTKESNATNLEELRKDILRFEKEIHDKLGDV
jgi:hypothetical protein